MLPVRKKKRKNKRFWRTRLEKKREKTLLAGPGGDKNHQREVPKNLQHQKGPKITVHYKKKKVRSRRDILGKGEERTH